MSRSEIVLCQALVRDGGGDGDGDGDRGVGGGQPARVGDSGYDGQVFSGNRFSPEGPWPRCLLVSAVTAFW